jgi:hypothetical protein
MNERIPETAPNGKRIVSACGVQAVNVPILEFKDGEVRVDAENPIPASPPSPVHDGDGALLFRDESGDYWTANELLSGIRDDDAYHHVVADIQRSMVN